MWNQPYLETCCRAALHRLVLSADDGRPPALKDGPCLLRIEGMGLAASRPDGRFAATEAGRERHASEIMRAGRVKPEPRGRAAAPAARPATPGSPG